MIAGPFSGRGGRVPAHGRALLFIAAALAALVLPGANAAQQPGSSTSAIRELAPPAPTPSTGNNEQRVRDAFRALPLAFVRNAGQTDARVHFSAHSAGAHFYFTQSDAVFAFTKGARRNKERVVLRLAFLGANPRTTIHGQARGTGKVNYFIGSDPSKWRTNLPTYGQVVYRDLWPGIDMVFRGNSSRLKYEFVVRPGAEVEDIRLAYNGAKRLSVGKNGQLGIETAAGTLTDARPVSYQKLGGKRVPVQSRFLLHPRHEAAYGFVVGGYDARQPLVIDPGLLYSTFLGGGSTDLGNPIAVDTAGNAYVTGETNSSDFPTTVGAFDTVWNGNIDAFVTKLNPTGSALVYSTFLGGPDGADRGFGIALDATANAHVTGETNSNNFPMTAAFDSSYNGNADVFVTKLNATGSMLLYSTYLGGSSTDIGSSVAVDGAGNTHVTGRTNSSSGFGMTGAFDTSPNGSFDVFVTKLNTTLAGAASRLYSTYLGGSSDDRGVGIAVDGGSNTYVTGETNSSSGFGMTGAFDTSPNGSFDVFVTKLNTTLAGAASRLYSTYLGGSADDRGFGIAVDGGGNAYVTGETDSSGFPTTTGAFDTTRDGIDAFVTKLNAAGSSLLYSTFLGGTNADRGFGIAVDTLNSAYVTGRTDSGDFPTTVGAFDTTFNNNGDAFVTKLDMIGAPATLTLSPTADTNPVGTSHTVTATVRDIAGNPVPGVTVRFSVTGANTTSGSATTDANGQATFTYTGTNTGPDAIHAFADTNNSGAQNGGEPFGDAAKTWTPAAPATLTLEPAADTNPVGTAHTVTATVRDAGGAGVANVVVRFTVTGSVTTSGQCTTVANGQCSFTYTGPNAPGADAIHAFADSDNDGVQDAGEPFGDATKAWTPAAPATLTLEPATDTNPVGTEHCVTATVRDAFANPTPGITVRFSVTGANNTSGSKTTNASGQATFCYTGTTVGADAIHAFADTDNDGAQDAGEPFGDATKAWTPAAPATLTLEPAADTNPVGTEHTVTATVRDALTNPTPGIVVRFMVTGSVSTSGQCTTAANGQCSFTYTGPNAPGADAIHAFADTDGDTAQDPGEPFGDATKTWAPAAPATLTLEPAADANPVGTEHCVTATARDALTNPTPGITVRFSVTGANSASGSATTNASGQAAFCYTGTTVGEDAIAAFADSDNDGTQDPGEPAGAATKIWTPGPPATLTLAPATATNTVGTQHCVTATVRDASGNPVPGVTVRFSVPTSVATFADPSSGSATTNASGEAMFCYSASLPGEDVIHAFADTNDNAMQDVGEPTGAATKTWTPPASTELCEVKITEGGWIVAKNGDQASFGGNAKVSADGATVQGQQEYQDHGPAQPRNVHSIKLLATTCSADLTTAAIFGTATINSSGEHVFRIDVMDLGQPGTDDTYGIMLSDGYVSGQKQLQKGNVTIHKT